MTPILPCGGCSACERCEALRWACGPYGIAVWEIHEHDVDAIQLGWPAYWKALREVHDPARAAELLRALLEARGVRVVDAGVIPGDPSFPYVSIDDGATWPNGCDAPMYVSMALGRCVTLILAQLAIPLGEQREAATRAVEEAG